jgi:hypothetical protein
MKPSWASWSNELSKISGVGWDLHGYSVKPNAMQKKLDESQSAVTNYESQMSSALGKSEPSMLTKKPGFFGRLIGRKSSRVANPAYPAYEKKMTDYLQTHGPYPDDSYDIGRGARISTPYDKNTNYKLNSNMDYDRPQRAGELEQWTTDMSYSDKPKIRNLTKSELRKVIKSYQQAMADYGTRPEEEGTSAAQQAFLDKAQYLLKDPKMQFARLEYE